MTSVRETRFHKALGRGMGRGNGGLPEHCVVLGVVLWFARSNMRL